MSSSTAGRPGVATPHRLRADAARNRERILAAAREAFGAHGTDVPLDEIARRAGVGNATLYRHFPDRSSLLFHVLLHVRHRIIERTEALLEGDHDPFEALRHVLLSASQERVGALCLLMVDSGVDLAAPELVAARERLVELTELLVERAHRAGQLRRDVKAADLLLAVTRLTRPLPGDGCPEGWNPTLVQRHLQIFLDGLRTPARSTLPGEAPELADLTTGNRG